MKRKKHKQGDSERLPKLSPWHVKGRSCMVESTQDYKTWLDLVQVLASGRAPSGIRVEGHLSLAGLRLRSLPTDLTVTGDLDLRQCQRLSRIGAGLKVGGSLLIGGKVEQFATHQKRLWRNHREAPIYLRILSREGQLPLNALPEYLEVGSDLVIRSAHHLKQLPQQLKVRRSLILEGCRQLKTLPDELNLTGDFILVGAPKLRELPKKISAQRLRVKGCGITYFPEQVTVQETLHLEHCQQLTTISEKTVCLQNGTLQHIMIHRCPIIELPGFLTAQREILLLKLPLKSLSNYLNASSIRIEGCHKLERVDGVIEAIRNLSLANCRKLSLLGFNVTCGVKGAGGQLRLENTNIHNIPDSLRQCLLNWKGHLIEAEAIFYPRDAERILLESNAELRRLMLEIIGVDKALQQVNAKVVDSDQDSGGTRSLIEVRILEKRKLRFLRCQDPSTGREYLLRVSPNCRTCHAAAAWLAGFENPADYIPILET